MPQHDPSEARAKILKALWRSKIKPSDQSQWRKRLGREIRLGEPKPLNKSQIESAAGMRARQTILNNVEKLKATGIRVVHVEKWRTGDPMEFYELTDFGCYWTAVLNPELEPEIRKKLGTRYEEFANLEISDLDFTLDLFRRAIKRGKSPTPNYEWTLIMTADAHARLSWRLKTRDLSA